jgi:UDP-3-O-[3-hydroxymyristoyl] glucosamine N-acyltransferase
MDEELKKILTELNIPLDVEGTHKIEALEKNKIAFFGDIKFKKYLLPNTGAYILTSKELYDLAKTVEGNTYIIVESPAKVFFKLHNLFHKGKKQFTVPMDSNIVIGENTEIHPTAKIYPNVVIGSNVKIGENTVIYPNVSIYDRIEIGKNCIIESGTVMGTEGFRTVQDEQGVNQDVTHLGKVIIGDFVKIGSCSAVNRGLFIDTVIENHVKIAGFCEIGHNTFIGENTVICSSVNVNGSTKIGKNCWISSGCSIADHVEIGDNCTLRLNSVVASSIPQNSTVAGFYAMKNEGWLMKIKDDFKKYCLNQKKQK